MALSSQVINLVGLYVIDQINQISGIGNITVMKEEASCDSIMRIAVKMIDPLGVKRTGFPDQTMYFVILG
jgi:hypothetical protein